MLLHEDDVQRAHNHHQSTQHHRLPTQNLNMEKQPNNHWKVYHQLYNQHSHEQGNTNQLPQKLLKSTRNHHQLTQHHRFTLGLITSSITIGNSTINRGTEGAAPVKYSPMTWFVSKFSETVPILLGPPPIGLKTPKNYVMVQFGHWITAYWIKEASWLFSTEPT